MAKHKTKEELEEIENSNRKAFWVAFIIFTIIVIIPSTVIVWRIYNKYLETDAPKIKIIQAPTGFGLQKTKIILEIEDAGSGLDEIVIRATERGVSRTIFSKNYEWGNDVIKDTIEVELSGEDKDKENRSIFPFRTGKIEVRAFDKSFWNNSATIEWDYLVDVVAPRVAPYTTQHNGTQGGTQLVVYRADDKNLTESGVIIRNRKFKGFPLSSYGADFEKTKNVYFALYAIPLDFNSQVDTISLYAEDAVGNTASAKINYRTRKFAKVNRNIEVNKSMLAKAESTYNDYYIAESDVYDIQADPPSGQLQKLELLLGEYRQLTNRRLLEISDKSVNSGFLQGALLNTALPLATYYGEQNNFKVDNQPVGSIISDGMVIHMPIGTEVTPHGDGIVSFAGKLGIYGNTIIVDHGFGVSTMYGHLSDIDTQAGSSVTTETIIGLSGDSGLVTGGRMFFAVLVHGYPVSPIEWTDKNWVHDHIINKLVDVKNDLGVSNTEEIDHDWITNEIEEDENRYYDIDHNTDYNTEADDVYVTPF